MHRRHLLAAALGATAVPLAACGTTDPARSTSPQTAQASAADPVTVTDGRGKKVTLTAPATRVVALEWGQIEDVITCGVQPVGVADIKGYRDWVSSAPITGDPVDVGLRTEPSVESVAKAEPDLILGIIGSIPDGAMARMEKIAPVVLLTAADASRPVELLKENFTTTATLLGKQDHATQVLADLDAKISDVKGRIADAGNAKAPYVFAYANEAGNQISFRMHGAGSVPGAFAGEVGLTNAWKKKGDKAWGLSTADVEALTKLPSDTSFLYWGNVESDPITGTLTNNAVWKSLDFVKRKQVYKVALKVWVYGGPASMMQWLDDLADVFAD